MSPEVIAGLIIGSFFGTGTLLAAFLISKTKQSIEMGAQLGPLSPDDRLRISLVLAAFETAEKELAKAAWRDGQPGHPQVMTLQVDLMELRYTAQKLLRES